ncbi:MAG: hypothetical protein JWQ71_3731 [Pedosphaera sp.]|nr:hypothetical protein [Pedosphaera sp.]
MKTGSNRNEWTRCPRYGEFLERLRIKYPAFGEQRLKRLLHTMYHESGHGAIAHHFGVEVAYVKVSLSESDGSHRGEVFYFSGPKIDSDKETLESFLKINLAGVMAACKGTGAVNINALWESNGYDDRQEAFTLIGRIAPRSRDRCLETAEMHVKELLASSDLWHRVQLLINALIEKPVVPMDDFYRLLGAKNSSGK